MTDIEIENKMKEITYGWVDVNGNKHIDVDETYATLYRLQGPESLLTSKCGVCWDQVELERYYFKGNDWNIKTYFLVYYDGDKCPTHTFLTFEKNNKYYWFEHSWERFRGIHEYESLKKMLLDIRNKFIKHELNNDYVSKNLVLHEYKKPKYHISVQEFYNHCDYGRYINFEEL